MAKCNMLLMDALDMLDDQQISKLRHNRMKTLESMCKGSFTYIDEGGHKVFEDMNAHRFINETMKELTILVRQSVIRANR